jgi:hypothetical protein
LILLLTQTLEPFTSIEIFTIYTHIDAARSNNKCVLAKWLHSINFLQNPY